MSLPTRIKEINEWYEIRNADTVPERELKNKLMKAIEDWSIQDLESLLGMVEGDMIQDIIHQRSLVISDELADAVMLGEWRR
tara:strand:- start:557 stop:802 length:246 start_codon:yes stop_codon:yes gene_type:complete